MHKHLKANAMVPGFSISITFGIFGIWGFPIRWIEIGEGLFVWRSQSGLGGHRRLTTRCGHAPDALATGCYRLHHSARGA